MRLLNLFAILCSKFSKFQKEYYNFYGLLIYISFWVILGAWCIVIIMFFFIRIILRIIIIMKQTLYISNYILLIKKKNTKTKRVVSLFVRVPTLHLLWYQIMEIAWMIFSCILFYNVDMNQVVVVWLPITISVVSLFFSLSFSLWNACEIKT